MQQLVSPSVNFSFDSLPHNPDFLTTLRRMPLVKIVGKGENAGNQHFLFFPHNVFYPVKNRNHYFSNISFVICKCFEFGPVEKKKSCLVKSNTSSPMKLMNDFQPNFAWLNIYQIPSRNFDPLENMAFLRQANSCNFIQWSDIGPHEP